MRVIATLFLFLLAGMGNAEEFPFTCQQTILDSQINCTFTSPGGTTTYVVSSTAQATPVHPGFAWISMQMSLNGAPCNSNYGTEVLLENSNVVTGTCSFSVRSNEVLHLSALAVTHNASPDGITIEVQKTGFSQDFVLNVARTGNGLVTSSDGKINCGFDCSENYLTTPASILLQASAAAGSGFTGWGGACSGTAATCIVTVSAATTVVANFTGSPSYPLVVSRIGNGIVTSYDGGIVCGTDCAESYDIPATVTLTAIASGGSPFTGWGGACSGVAATCTITVDSAKLVTATFGGQAVGTVVEFRNLVLDHYFVTASASEASAIDSGSAGLGWTRTGNTFKAGGPVPACRFYGSVSPGPNSHFFTADPAECLFLKQLQATSPGLQPRWNFEGNDFTTTLPVNSGSCSGDLAPVYRAYNNGLARHIDSNHRITTEFAGIQEVLARGWIYEGVVMCAPR